MPAAARVNDATAHGPPLAPGPGSPDVVIGNQAAWRAVPSGVAGSVNDVSSAMQGFMKKSTMTPADAAADLAQINQGLTRLAADGAGAGASGAPAAAAGQVATLNATNASLTSAWAAANAVPGNQAAAAAAYTQGIKNAAAAAASGVMSSLAGVADMHNCPNPTPTPPHGPGFVTKGSATVFINNLPAVRQGDQVMETCGGADPIAVGLASVEIGDLAGAAGGGGGAAGGGTTADAGSSGADDVYQEEAASGSAAAVEKATVEQAGPLLPLYEPGAEQTWIGIKLLDFDDRPLVSQPFTATLTNGQVLEGVTDAEGYARFDGIQPGRGEVVFIEIPDDPTPVEDVDDQAVTDGEEHRPTNDGDAFDFGAFDDRDEAPSRSVPR